MASNLFQTERKLQFKGHQLTEFKDQIAKDSNSREIIKLDPKEKSPKQFLLSKSGLMDSKYALTRTGVLQLCNVLSPGLYQVVKGLITDEHPMVDHTKADLRAVAIINNLLVHKAPALDRHKAIVCSDRKQLDGFVTGSYQLVSNDTVFRHFENACEMVGSMRMHTAYLNGQTLTVIMVPKKPKVGKVTGAKNVKFQVGVMLQNSETAGKAIQTMPVVMDNFTKRWSCGKANKECTVQHRKGKVFQNKMMMMGDALSKRYKEEAKPFTPSSTANVKLPPQRKETWTAQKLVETGSLATISQLKGLDFDVANAHKFPRWMLYQQLLKAADSLAIEASLVLRQTAFNLITTHYVLNESIKSF